MAKEHIVAVDGFWKAPPVNFDHETTIYEWTTPDQLPDRIKDATILTVAAAKVTRAGIEAASKLKLICCTGVLTNSQIGLQRCPVVADEYPNRRRLQSCG